MELTAVSEQRAFAVVQSVAELVTVMTLAGHDARSL
jgi:hypothetical protein